MNFFIYQNGFCKVYWKTSKQQKKHLYFYFEQKHHQPMQNLLSTYHLDDLKQGDILIALLKKLANITATRVS